MASADIAYDLEFKGLFQWYSREGDCLFERPEADLSGIYLWAVERDGAYMTYYVGESGRSFRERFTEHADGYLNGYYRLYDPEPFARGEKKEIWSGMWKPDTRHKMCEFRTGGIPPALEGARSRHTIGTPKQKGQPSGCP